MAGSLKCTSLSMFSLFWCFILLLHCPTPVTSRGTNGGFLCAGCTFVLTVIGQVSEIQNTSIAQTVGEVCNLLPEGIYQGACYALIEEYAPAVIKLLNNKVPPDAACHSLDMCFTLKGRQMCHIAPVSKHVLQKQIWKGRRIVEKYLIMTNRVRFPNICAIPPVQIVCDLWDRVSNTNKAGFDMDGDGFSTFATLRGAYWRGRDCNKYDSTKHPGAKPQLWDSTEDTNCNGIHGVDENTGRPWEDLYCSNSGRIGIAALGDSVTAHFHIPHQWVNSSQFNKEILKFLPMVVENEFDFPMMSSSTGYSGTMGKWPIIEGPVDSIYLRLRERNRCNHRDFQNIGVNGADSNDMQHIQKSLSRNNMTDVPLLVVYALVGNDVCNWYADDTVAHMTTPAQMRRNLIRTLTYLDSRLPLGSHVLTVGMADGRILYDTLHNRIHPLGNLHKNIRYKDLYQFLDCLLITPCAGWMNKNETIRDATTKRAEELTAVIMDVSRTRKFKNFDISFIPNPMKSVIENWQLLYGKENIYKLIDLVDGFHPNQFAQALIAKHVWDYLSTTLPHLIGDINPYNFDIADRFGDQGGY